MPRKSVKFLTETKAMGKFYFYTLVNYYRLLFVFFFFLNYSEQKSLSIWFREHPRGLGLSILVKMTMSRSSDPQSGRRSNLLNEMEERSLRERERERRGFLFF